MKIIFKMGRKKKEQTFIKSIRVDKDMKEFLESLDNANFFVLQLLKNTDEYKKFIVENIDDDTKSLFENII